MAAGNRQRLPGSRSEGDDLVGQNGRFGQFDQRANGGAGDQRQFAQPAGQCRYGRRMSTPWATASDHALQAAVGTVDLVRQAEDRGIGHQEDAHFRALSSPASAVAVRAGAERQRLLP